MGGEGGVGGGGGGGMLVGKGSSGSSSSKCGRWNPTGEQVKVLTELFRSGLRTPSSDQIQKISHQLSFYGNIESKNVFYWFQNHKARERQKRRKLDHNTATTTTTHTQQQQQHFIHPLYHHNNINLLPPSSNHFADESTRTRTRNKSIVELEPERMMKTLQLFPINSIDEAEGGLSDEDHHHHHEFRVNNNGFKKHYKIETKMDHPPLDLRLSFL